MSDEGALQFARYAYPPNELGYCGPDGAHAMLDPAAVADIGRRARQFDGAWCYLEALADALGVGDPLSAEVVEAYWIGNDLLDALDPGDLVTLLTDRFRGQPGGTWREAADRALAHHSFQVFEVYPWAGLLRAGRPAGPAVQVLDRCRIRVGTVQAVQGDDVTVTCRGLGWDGSSLLRLAESPEAARWSVGGRSLIDPPTVGALVALHWDWVCETVTADQARRVVELEERQWLEAGLATGPVSSGRTP